MAFLENYYCMLLTIFFLVSFAAFLSKKPKTHKNYLPTNWINILSLVAAHRFLDYATDVLKANNGIFVVKGRWVPRKELVFTSHPADVDHILSRNSRSYPRGSDFHKIFDVFGYGIFNSESKLWELHHKTIMSLLKHPGFKNLLETVAFDEIEKGLIPVLDFVSEEGMEMDLQEAILERFTFDVMCKLVLDYDMKCLSINFPCFNKALTEMEEVVFYRHFFPQAIWRLQKWLRVGPEKKLGDSLEELDMLIYECIRKKKDELLRNNNNATENFNLLTFLMAEYKDYQTGAVGDHNKFMRDTLLNLLVAGKDTISTALSWFFYLVAKNPSVEEKTREEIFTKLGVKAGETFKRGAKELESMVYLHGALLEALRLFPPVPFEHQSSLHADVLPSGHKVEKDTNVLLSFYSMGRMESIWGEDCLEFKPERWFTDDNRIKRMPSNKFVTFNAGPRACLGKDMAFFLMKMVAVVVVSGYRVELVGGHPVVPSNSVILRMKYGLKVKFTKLKQ